MNASLKIYTMTHCPTCEDTFRLVKVIEERIPELRVEIVNLDDPGNQAPPEVFSVPTYMLNGDVVSLGNPYFIELEAIVRRYIRA